MELARNLKVESVGQLPLSLPLGLGIHQTVDDAVQLMRQKRLGCVLLTDAGRLEGIFTEKDLLSRILVPRLGLDTPLKKVATCPPNFVRSGEPIGVAMAKMVDGHLRHLPVVDEGMRPIGLLTSRILLHFLAGHFLRTIHTLKPRRQARGNGSAWGPGR